MGQNSLKKYPFATRLQKSDPGSFLNGQTLEAMQMPTNRWEEAQAVGPHNKVLLLPLSI